MIRNQVSGMNRIKVSIIIINVFRWKVENKEKYENDTDELLFEARTFVLSTREPLALLPIDIFWMIYREFDENLERMSAWHHLRLIQPFKALQSLFYHNPSKHIRIQVNND